MTEQSLSAAIRKAIENMPYLDHETDVDPDDPDNTDMRPITLREFYEGTWQGIYADQLFDSVEKAIAGVLAGMKE